MTTPFFHVDLVSAVKAAESGVQDRDSLTDSDNVDLKVLEKV
jgi:hypothetical protein